MRGGRRRRRALRIRLNRDIVNRLLLVIPFVIAAGWLTVAVSGANIMRSVRPDLAMNFQPLDARARVKAAEQLMSRAPGERDQLAEVERLSLEALQRDPTLAPAWRMLGLVAVARNQGDRAATMFRFAGAVSKRDLPTQLWLIEERVRANDIVGALVHYDLALRTNANSYDILLPILVSATSDPTIVTAISRLLNTMPPWRRDYLARLANGAPNPANAAMLFGMVMPQADAAEREIAANAMRDMIQRRQFRPALRIYQLLDGGGQQAALPLRNGSFDRPNSFPPLDWQLQEQTDLRAEQVVAGDGHRLRLFATNGQGGSAARQLLFLPPGTYQISAQAAAVPDSRPARLGWSIQCGTVQDTMLLQQQLPPLSGQIVPSATFTVPATGCDGQWLSLNIQPDFDPGGVAGSIDSLTIRRL